MPNNFITTRTPGSRTSTYELADHIVDPDPHPQYLFRTEFTESGDLTDGKLEAHNSDPNAHDGYLAKLSDLNKYVAINNFPSVLASHLYHDYTDTNGAAKAASIKAVNDAYTALNSVLLTHRTGYTQGASTDHKDNENKELYAHRTHKHSLTDLGAAEANHNHDNRYSLLSHDHDDQYARIVHSHNYLSEEDLALVGVYPHTLEGTNDSDSDGTVIPFNFNEETTQGNISLAPDVMSGALNGPNVGNLTFTSFLNVVTNIVADDTTNDDGTMVYGERNCSQILYTTDGVYFRIGHRASGTPAVGAEESSLWTFGEWSPMGGGGKDIFEVFYSTSASTPRGAFPLWTGETIINCQTMYPTFWQRALEYQSNGTIRVVTSTVYDQEIATYGECGAFVIDTNAGSIRLPKITRFVSSLGAISDIGVTLPAGLPNITGKLVIYEGNGSSTFGISTNNSVTDGAFTKHVVSANRNGISRTEGSFSTFDLGFDASKSNSIYGSANTVQPPSVCLALYIQVFNTITPTATTDLEARVGVLEANAIMFARHDFTAATGTGGWQQNSDGFYEYTFMTNHFTLSHIYMTESGGSVLVDESVEVHIVGNTASEAIDRDVKLVAPQPFAGYIITLG